ncbi:MAG: hypothetical protein ABSG46_20220 [Candidatus Binataceae bacterium]|jgi:hypothetical protein
MFGLIAFVCFLIALIMFIITKGVGHDAKYAIDFAFAGAAFLCLHLTWGWYPWRHGAGV